MKSILEKDVYDGDRDHEGEAIEHEPDLKMPVWFVGLQNVKHILERLLNGCHELQCICLLTYA